MAPNVMDGGGEGKEAQSPPAERGDMVVRNRCAATGGEEYLVKSRRFAERYEGPLSPADGAGWLIYRPRAETMLYFIVRPSEGMFTFQAPWSEPMVAAGRRNRARPEKPQGNLPGRCRCLRLHLSGHRLAETGVGEPPPCPTEACAAPVWLILMSRFLGRPMADVFITYSRRDKEQAARIAEALRQHGWSVWWDDRIPIGQSFDRVIEEALTSCSCVVVLWSKSSTESNWVKAEANEGLQRGILVPVLVEDAPIPLEFRRIQTANLAHVNETEARSEFNKFVEAVAATVKKPAAGHSDTIPFTARPARPQLVDYISLLVRHYIELWVSTVRDPVSVIAKIDPAGPLTQTLGFFIFIYIIVFLIRLPLFALLSRSIITDPALLFAIFLVNAVSAILFLFVLHVSAKVVFGKGDIWQSFHAAVYLLAYWPFLQIALYVLFSSPAMRAQYLGRDVPPLQSADLIAMSAAAILVLAFFCFFTAKMIPVLRHVHAIGSIRAALVSVATLVGWILATAWTTEPIHTELVKSSLR